MWGSTVSIDVHPMALHSGFCFSSKFNSGIRSEGRHPQTLPPDGPARCYLPSADTASPRQPPCGPVSQQVAADPENLGSSRTWTRAGRSACFASMYSSEYGRGERTGSRTYFPTAILVPMCRIPGAGRHQNSTAKLRESGRSRTRGSGNATPSGIAPG